MQVHSKPDRRHADRLAVPACAVCHADAPMVVALRTVCVVYFRCNTCGGVDIVLKPERSLREHAPPTLDPSA